MTIRALDSAATQEKNHDRPRERAANDRYGQANPVANWAVETFDSASALEAFAQQARHDLEIKKIDHDVEWLSVLSDKPGEKLVVLVDREGDDVRGIAPFHVHPSGLTYSLGEIGLFQKRVERFALDEGPITRRPNSREAIDGCFEALAGVMTGKNVVFFGGVPTDSDLHSLMNDPKSTLRKNFYVVPYGPEYQRCKLDWPGAFEPYLSQLTSRERGTVRRTIRKFEKRENLETEVRRFETEADVETFLTDAVPVSAKTYQTKLLGIGLTKGGALERELKAAAARRYFLGHIMYVNGVAAAFQYGYVYNRCFFRVAGGYDPDYADMQLGIVLFLETLKDFETHKDPLDLIDHLYGEATYKLRTSNIKIPERHYYLIPRTLRGAMIAKSMVAMDSFSRWVGSFLEKHGLKDRIKKLIRRSA